MFERFTAGAREVVITAAGEAAARGEPVSPVHLLVATASTLDLGFDADQARATLGAADEAALAALGIDFEEVRRRVEETFGPDALRRPGRRHSRFDPHAKRALELALRRAIGLGHRSIGAEHVVLGVLASPSHDVDDVLAGVGTDRATVERRVLAALGQAA